MLRQVPAAAELAAHPAVQNALDLAWAESNSNDPRQRHEEGGWIYMHSLSGDIQVRRASSGEQAAIDLSDPPLIAGYVVVGKFHTHPNPSADGWNPGPSSSDQVIDELHGVPDLIRADDGVHFCGPARRRGGLDGSAGFPM